MCRHQISHTSAVFPMLLSEVLAEVLLSLVPVASLVIDIVHFQTKKIKRGSTAFGMKCYKIITLLHCTLL